MNARRPIGLAAAQAPAAIGLLAGIRETGGATPRKEALSCS
jgi:hypothetical protein